MVMKSMPGAAIFGSDVLFDIPYVADWNAIGWHWQKQVNQDNARENAKRIDFDYAIRDKVLLCHNGGISCKGQDKYLGPYTIT